MGNLRLREQNEPEALGDSCYLGDVQVNVEALTVPLDLPHTELAGELTRVQAEALQGEGAVEAALAATPDVVEGDLLRGARRHQELSS